MHLHTPNFVGHTHTHTNTPPHSELCDDKRAVGRQVMDGTAGTLPMVGITVRPGVLIQTLQVVGSRADVTAVEGPNGAALETRVEVDVGVQLGILSDLDVLVAEHAGVVYHLAPGHQTVWFVQGQGALDALEEVGVVDRRDPNARALCTDVQRANET